MTQKHLSDIPGEKGRDHANEPKSKPNLSLLHIPDQKKGGRRKQGCAVESPGCRHQREHDERLVVKRKGQDEHRHAHPIADAVCPIPPKGEGGETCQEDREGPSTVSAPEG